MKGWGILFVCLMAAIFSAPQHARAQEEALGASYLTPFPPGEVYNVAVIGDDMADGLLFGLGEVIGTDRRMVLRPKRHTLNGLNRPVYAERLVSLEEDLKRETPQIAIIMLGAWDRVSLRGASEKKVPVGSPAWRTEYASRADRLMKMLKRLNVSVYWVSLPNVRKADANEDAQMINEVLRERIFLNNMKFIDVYTGFLTEQGGYDAFGPDLSGKIVRLRDGDGVYFTGAGYRKLGHFVERDLRRDLTQARANRDVPLAGAEAEQAKINPDKAKLAEPAPPAAAGKTAEAQAASVAAASASATAEGAAGEQKAETGKISLKTVSASGKEETLNLDIVRPLIPASVVQLVTRRESPDKPSQMGDILTDPIAGGLLIMNSVTPSRSAGDRSGALKVSAAQTPYFRVLFKGERLAPKPGRADDQSWPRQPSPALRAAKAKAASAAPLAPEETGSTDAAPAKDERKPKR